MQNNAADEKGEKININLTDEWYFTKKNETIRRERFFATSGQSGEVVLDQKGDRFNSFEVWTYGPGNGSYYSYMIIDTSLPVDKVRHMAVSNSPVVHCHRRSPQTCHQLLAVY